VPREWGAPTKRRVGTSSIKFADLVRSGAPYPTFGYGAYFGRNIVEQLNHFTRQGGRTGYQTTSVVLSSVIGYGLLRVLSVLVIHSDDPYGHVPRRTLNSAHIRCVGLKGLAHQSPGKHALELPDLRFVVVSIPGPFRDTTAYILLNRSAISETRFSVNQNRVSKISPIR